MSRKDPPMAEPSAEPERIWENGFDGHGDAQLFRLSKLSFLEKLKWLDEMGKLFQSLKPVK